MPTLDAGTKVANALIRHMQAIQAAQALKDRMATDHADKSYLRSGWTRATFPEFARKGDRILIWIVFGCIAVAAAWGVFP